jgi:hypothetical protein
MILVATCKTLYLNHLSVIKVAYYILRTAKKRVEMASQLFGSFYFYVIRKTFILSYLKQLIQ